jgi:hypothetical protein
MKKLSIILLVIFVNNLSFSQIQKGTWLLGGSVNYNNSSARSENVQLIVNKTSTNSFGITPNINYFISDKFSIGGGLGFNVFDFSNTVTDPKSSTSSQITYNSFINGTTWNAFLQAKYINLIKKDIYWNVNFRAGVGKTSYETNNKSFIPTGTPIYSTVIIDGLPVSKTAALTSQFLFFPIKNLGLQVDVGGLNYSHQSPDFGNTELTSTNLLLSFAPNNWSLGVFYVFGIK